MKRRVLVALVGLAACSAPKAHADDPTYPGVIHPASELSPDFVVEQHIEATKNDRTGGFDAVLQKKGADLTIIGLGPLGIRAFVLKQVGADATFEQTMGPAFPFPPRNVLIDIHRAFFKRLPGGRTEGRTEGKLDDEDVTEVWKDGNLVERSYRRSDRGGAVRVLYKSGCTREQCAPTELRIVNEWFGYELTIENRRYQFLRCSSSTARARTRGD